MRYVNLGSDFGPRREEKVVGAGCETEKVWAEFELHKFGEAHVQVTSQPVRRATAEIRGSP